MIKISSLSKWLIAVLFLVLAGCQTTPPKNSATPEVVWYSKSSRDETRLHLYVFWSQTCPHCRKALTFIGSLWSEYPWLDIQSYEISQHPENAQRFMQVSESLGEKPKMVPTFFFCGQMHEGFRSAETTGQALKDSLLSCYQKR